MWAGRWVESWVASRSTEQTSAQTSTKKHQNQSEPHTFENSLLDRYLDVPLQVLDHEARLHTAELGDLLVIADTIVKSAHPSLFETTKKWVRVEACRGIRVIRDERGCFLAAAFRGHFLHV